MYFSWLDFFKAFFALFVVMDALGNVPIFATLCEKISKKKTCENVSNAIIVAGIILFLFLFFGNWILFFFGINLVSFKVAGGIIIGLIGLKFVLGLHYMEQRAKEYEVAIVPLATPLITGPGVITTVIFLVQQYGYLLTIIVSLLNLWFTWYVLRNAPKLLQHMGKHGADVLKKIMGLILTAIGVHFILTALGLV